MAGISGGRRTSRATTVVATIAALLAGLVPLVALAEPAAASHGGAGDLDTSFAGDGTTSGPMAADARITDAAVQPDGKILAVGSGPSAGQAVVARFNADGSMDASFGGGDGWVDFVAPQRIWSSVALQPDGNIVVGGVRAGSDTGNHFFEVTRLLPDGSVDPAFFPSGGGFYTASVSAANHVLSEVLVQSDGKIVFVGWVPQLIESPSDIVARRLNADGSTDFSFGDSGTVFIDVAGESDEAYAATLTADDRIVIAGGAVPNTSPFVFDSLLIRLTANGAPDATFAGTGITTARKYGGQQADLFTDVTIDSAGRIVTSGYVIGICLNSLGGNGTAASVARTLPDGSADTSFYAITGRHEVCTADGYLANAVAVDAADRVTIGGSQVHHLEGGSVYGTVVQRFTAAGALDDSFGLINGFAFPGGSVADSRTGINAVALQADGKTLAAGHHGGGWFLARLTGDLPPPPAPALLLAYESNASGASEIWTIAADGTGATQRTSLGSFAAFPSFLGTAGMLFESTQSGGDFDVWARYADGTYEVLTDNTIHDGVPAVSPDGTRVAFMSDQPAPLGRGVYVAALADLQVAPADPSRWTKVAALAADSFGRPSWAPEGDRLAFHTGGEIWVVGADGTGLRQLTVDSAHDQDASWSGLPGDDRIVFARAVDAGRRQLYLVEADHVEPDSSVQPLLESDSGASDGVPAFSPDGAFVAFTRSADSNDDLHLVDLATRTVREVVASASTIERRPAWQPIGGELSLTTTVAGPLGTSPEQVPSADIPLQDSPHVQSSTTIESAPAGLLGLDTTPAGLLGLDTTPAALLSLDTTPAALLGLDTTPAALLSLDTTPAAARQALDEILLSQLDPSPLTWEGILGRPVVLQATSLLDVLIEDPANLSSVQLVHLLGDGSALDSLSVGGIMLGPVTVGRIAEPAVWDDPASPSWHTRVGHALGDPTFSGAFTTDLDDATAPTVPLADMPLMWLELAGVPFDGTDAAALPFQAVPLGHIDLIGDPATPADDAPLASFTLGAADLAHTSLGLVTVGSLPAGSRSQVTSCGSECDTKTLHQLQLDGQLNGTAPFRAVLDGSGATTDQVVDADDLILGEVVSAFLGITQRPFGFVDPALVAAYRDPAYSNAVPYELSYHGPLGNPTVAVDAPDNLVYEPGSGRVIIDEVIHAVDPSISTAGGERRLTWDLSAIAGGIGSFDVQFRLLTGTALGSFDLSAAVTTTAGTTTIDHVAPVTVVPGFGGGADLASAPLVETERLYLPGFATGGKHLYRIPAHLVPEGSQVEVFVGNIAPGADLDAVLYRDLGSAELPLRPPAVSRDPILPVPDDGIDLSDSGEPLTAEIRADVDFEDLPVMAASANRGNTSEYLAARVPAGGGDLVVQVSPYLGNAPDHAHTLFIRTTAAPTSAGATTASSCGPRGSELFAHDSDPYGAGGKAETTVGVMPASIAADRTSLLLVNRDRISDIYGEQAAVDTMAALGRLVNDATVGPRVKAVILPIDGDTDVRTAFRLWDESPCSAARANDVVRAINAAVDRLRLDANGAPVADIQHIALFGGDDVLPFARIADGTQQDNEATYAPALGFLPANSPLRAAYAAGMIPSDDGYGDLDPEPWLDRFLYVSDVAMGRVVGGPPTWIEAVDRFVTFKGAVDPSTALTTAYDFLSDMGAEVDASVEAQLGSTQPELIDPPTAWTATDLRNAFTPNNPTPPDLVSLNGHFSHYFMEPAAGSATFGTGEVAGGPSLARRLIHSIGCHSGTSVTDVVVGGVDASVAALYQDWAKTAAQKGAAGFVGQTGYGLGLDGFVALSERIMADYAAFLDGSVTTGTALLRAKQRYRRDVGTYGVYDEKALVEATYYGLPFWTIAGSAPTAPTDPAPVTSPVPYTDILTASVIDVDPTFGTPITTTDGQTLTASAAGARSGFVTTAGRPIQPALHYSMAPGARDALVLSYDASDRTGWDPDYANAVVDLAGREGGQEDGDVVFPAAPVGVTDGQLTVVPGQFRTTDHVSGLGVQRRYDEMRVLVTHGEGDAPRIRPRFGAIDSAIVDGGGSRSAAFRVEVSDPDGEVTRVVALYEDEANPGVGRSVDLVRQAGTHVWTGGAVVTGEKVLYAIQACDNLGWCAHVWNKGLLFEAREPAPSPAELSGEIVVDVAGSPDPAPSGWYTSATVTLTGPEGVSFEYRRPQDTSFQAYTGPVAIDGPDGVNLVEWRASSGDQGTVAVPIDTAAPTVTVFRPTHDQGFTVGSTVTPLYACADAGSGVATCQPSSDPLDTSSVGDKTFTVTATDHVGRSATASVAYRVEYKFTGFFEPVKNGVLNGVKAGSTVPVKWRLEDEHGYERSLLVVEVIDSQQISCQGMAVVEMTLIELPLSTLHYDLLEEQYVYGFKTQKAWKSTCRSLNVRLDDGSVHTAYFKFS